MSKEEIKLDESWDRFVSSRNSFYNENGGKGVAFTRDYIYGASDFQKRAIEELKKYISPSTPLSSEPYELAIEILKNLKP